jgi:hypothetical protein
VPESKVISLEERAKEEQKPFLEQLLREGARKLLQAAIENEVIDYIQFHKDRARGAVSPTRLRWASDMYPDTYILDVNGNPVASQISSEDANGLRANNIAFFAAPILPRTFTSLRCFLELIITGQAAAHPVL